MKVPDPSSNNHVEILLAEDSPTQAEQLRHLLERHQYTVRVAGNGRDALTSMRIDPPTIVVSDIVMPSMDGYALCREIKSDEKFKGIPVILLTSLSGAEDVIKGLQCGADNFIRKPYDEKYLLSRIEYILANQALRSKESLQMGVEVYLGGERHFITAQRQQILDLLISTYGEAVHINAELKQRQGELARSLQTLHGLYRIAESLNQCRGLQEVLERALDRAMELPGVQAGWISLREAEAGFRVVAARGLPPALEAAGAMEGDCLCRRKLVAGELDSVTNILECERLLSAKGETRGLRYHASIPLWSDDLVVGVMNLAGPEQGMFREDDLKVLYGVGSQVCVAIERAHLLEELESKVETRTAALAAEVAERKRAEEALRESETRYRELFENAPYGIYKATLEGRFLDVNLALVRILGYDSPGELLSVNLARDVYRNPDDPVRSIKQLGQAESFEGVEVNWKRKDGTPILVRLSGRVVQDEKGDTRGFEAIAEDITEWRMLEKQNRQLQKFEAIGQLAGGIAHDFNNVIGTIMGWAEIGLEEAPAGSRLESHLQTIRGQAERAANLTRQLLAFARRQILEPRNVNLNSIVLQTVALLGKLIGEQIEVQTALADDLEVTRADPTQLEQVLMNLCLNARDAMPNGGRLLIETQNVELSLEYCRFHKYARPGRYVLLAASDTGVGMDPPTLEHIFEPFFTTKEVGQGTGLGLATVYGIVKQHGGFVHVYSEPQAGSTFRIYLPVGSGVAENQEKTQAEPVRGGSELILVAEDHEGLREMAREILEGLGYHVLLAVNGEEAVHMFQAQCDRIALVLLDVVMPKLGGTEACSQIRSVKPRVPVIFSTGYSAEMAVLNSKLEANIPVLQKPYSPASLGRKVREVLDRAARK